MLKKNLILTTFLLLSSLIWIDAYNVSSDMAIRVCLQAQPDTTAPVCVKVYSTDTLINNDNYCVLDSNQIALNTNLPPGLYLLSYYINNSLRGTIQFMNANF